MKRIFLPASVALLFLLQACTATRSRSGNDQKISFQFMQINDVYEIAPLSGGKEGGLARVAQVKKELLKQEPNTFLVMAGDFLSPSVYNSLQYQGKAIRGKQMVAALNAAGLDFAVFGNHEFDIRETELQERLNESAFQWISSNALHKVKGQLEPFAVNGKAIPRSFILPLHDADGTTARIGIISATLPFNKADYVGYTDANATAIQLYRQLKDSVDGIIAFTHQSVKEDQRLADSLPGLLAILGGHEHDMRFIRKGEVYITKAHANAKSAFVINIDLDLKKQQRTVQPVLKMIDEKISMDSTTAAVVAQWTRIANENYSSLGFDALRIIQSGGASLDGREAEVRSHPTNLTRLLVKSMQYAVPKADVVLVNAGSIRVDDVLNPPISEYDILRTLPFGGGIREADMKGSLIIKALDQGIQNRGIGGYLLTNENIQLLNSKWMLGSEAIDPDKVYHVALSDFLFTGKEANLSYLQPQHPEVVKVYDPVSSVQDPRSDIRLALINYILSGKH